MQDIKLFYQPVQEPCKGIIFFIITTIIVILSEFINYNVFNEMKNNTGLWKSVTQLQSYTIMIGLPYYLLSVAATDFVHSLNEILGQWFCTCAWFFIKVCMMIVGFHSFSSACLRYFFIIHHTKSTKYQQKECLFWTYLLKVYVCEHEFIFGLYLAHPISYKIHE